MLSLHRRLSLILQPVSDLAPEQIEAANSGAENNDAREAEALSFDFDAHRRQAVERYQSVEGLYTDFARAVYSVITTCLANNGIKVHSVDHRAKSPESFGQKAGQAADGNPGQPKYADPFREITDLAGVRVITYFPSTEARVDSLIANEFDVIEKTDRSELLKREERLGYHSIHYLVTLKENRSALPEYARFNGLVAEIQVRTILQHAWAEIEHDIQYKAVSALPTEIRRRFLTLAGLLEIADREFQALEDEDRRLREEARLSVAEGRLDEVEITPDALKSYVDQTLGMDGRMADFSYWWTARLLRQIGFDTLGQVDRAVSSWDDDHISRVIHGGRQGQLTRLEDVLLAAMGDEFIRRHPWSREPDNEWLMRGLERRRDALVDAGIPLGNFRPEDDVDNAQ